MKQVLTLLTVLVLTAPIMSLAQTKTGRVSGKVGDADQIPVAAATITLLQAKDSSVVKMSVSGKDGHFEFDQLANGQYLLLVSAVAYEKAYSESFNISGAKPAVAVAPIILSLQVKDLKAVTVAGRKPMVEQKIDRTVVNVDAFVTNVGANALEVLEKSPGIQVDKDGNISLKGKQGVIILLDGRPAYLSGADLANMLKGMQASQLEQIEIMTNPPAKFDASGNAGVINIKTKKNKVKGFNGNASVGASQGYYFKTNESLSLNYRNGKLNLFSNYSFNYHKGFQQLDIFRRYKNNDESTNAVFEQISRMTQERTSNNLKLGMDYYLNKKTTLGIVLGGFYNPEANMGINTSYLQNPDFVTDSIVYATSDIEETWKNFSTNLNMRHQFDTTGRELSVDVDYIKYNTANDQLFVNSTYNPDWVKKYDETLLGDLPVSINIYSAKADYIQPLKGNARLELGWKSSYVETENRANYFEWMNSTWEPDYDKTNYFDYKENINAAYVSLNKQLTKKWGIQAGLRFENTNLEGRQFGNPTKQDSSFNRSYNSWFPTVYISYGASKNHQFGASFGRRIDRPAYQDLNPFLFFLDKYTYGSGNPFLRPQYSNNFEVSHIFKGFLTTTLNYSRTKDLFTETFDQSGYATIVRQGNIGRRENAGISVSAQVPVAKWLTTMVYTNYNYTKYSGRLYGEDIEVEAGTWLMNLNNQFRFGKGWSAELSGWYRSRGVEGQILINAMGEASAGISKQVLKGKGTVKLNMRDIFYTRQARGEINFQSTEARFKNMRDSRVANITFTYRFGKPLKNGNGQRKKGGAGDEENRVKIGG